VDSALRRKILDSRDVVVVISVEQNEMYPQALLLCESIRRFGGPFSEVAIVAVSPRPQLALDREERTVLQALGVDYYVEDLNQTGSTYGPINRIVASAWVERYHSSPYVLALDSDTLFVAAPDFFDADVGTRPVDAKGATSEGPQDPAEEYWKVMCSYGGIQIHDLPFVKTSVDKRLVRAAYNGGFTLIRRSTGIFQAAEEIFFQSFRSDTRPFRHNNVVLRTSTGQPDTDAAQFWTSGQAAMSVAIAAKTSDVFIYGDEYNIPLHALGHEGASWGSADYSGPILLHYHDLMRPSRSESELEAALRVVRCPDDVADWLIDRRFSSELVTSSP